MVQGQDESRCSAPQTDIRMVLLRCASKRIFPLTAYFLIRKPYMATPCINREFPHPGIVAGGDILALGKSLEPVLGARLHNTLQNRALHQSSLTICHRPHEVRIWHRRQGILKAAPKARSRNLPTLPGLGRRLQAACIVHSSVSEHRRFGRHLLLKAES